MIEINGIKYEEREEPKRSGRSSKLLLIAAAFGALDNYGQSYTRERPQVDLEKEFELIQNKQSKLSRNDRDWVVATFNRKYKQIS